MTFLKFSYLDGLIWLLPTIAVGFFAFQLRQFYLQTKRKIAQFFFYSSICFLIYLIMETFRNFFFPNNLLVLKWLIVISTFITSLGFAFFSYLIFYIKFPKIPAIFGFLTVLILAIVILILNLLLPPAPSIREGEIKGNLHPLPAISFFILALTTVLPLGVITIRGGLSLKPSKERTRALGLGIMCFLGIIIIFFLTIFEVSLIRRILTAVWGISIFLLTYLTQKPLPSPYVKKI